jgi:Protein of unknown function (DUF4239)
MLHFLFDLPFWVICPGLVGSMCVFALLGLRLVRARVLTRWRVGVQDSDFVGTIVQSVMVCYALVVALIAVKVWETHGATSQTVSAEAAATAAFYRDVSNYPEPLRGELQAGVRDYVEYVIRDAWPLQREGKMVPLGGVQLMDRIQGLMAGFEPATEGQKAYHQEAWRAFNRLIELRRLRLDAVGAGLPTAMWLVVLLGAAIGLCTTFFFRVEDVRLHITLVLLLASFLGLVVFVIVAMDRPYRGDLGIGPDSFQLVLDQLMKR